MFRLGFIINPVAGIGGAVGLKGSDGVVAEALARGAVPKAQERARQALLPLCELTAPFELLTVAGEMGEAVARELGLPCRVIYQPATESTSADDTRHAAGLMREAGVDLLLFAGGDGTARDICAAVGESCHVLGIPAGCKIHSGVYGVTPAASGRVVARMIAGELLSLIDAEVRDIDEEAFRAGKVRARHYGQLKVPGDLRYIQAVKQGGKESEELVLADLAAGVVEQMEPDTLYLMGSGSTVAACMAELALENTLLGVDLVENGRLIGAGSQRRRDPDPDPRSSLPTDHYPDRRTGTSVRARKSAIESRGDSVCRAGQYPGAGNQSQACRTRGQAALGGHR